MAAVLEQQRDVQLIAFGVDGRNAVGGIVLHRHARGAVVADERGEVALDVELQVGETYEVGRGTVHEVEMAADGAHLAAIAHAVGDRAVQEEDGLGGLLCDRHGDVVDPFARDDETAVARCGVRILLHRDEDGSGGLIGRHLDPLRFGSDDRPLDVHGRDGDRLALLAVAEGEVGPVDGQLRLDAVLHHFDRYRFSTPPRDGDAAAAGQQVVPRSDGHFDRIVGGVGSHVDPGVALLDLPARALRVHGQHLRSAVGLEDDPVGRRDGDVDRSGNDRVVFVVAARCQTDGQEQEGQSDE